MNKNGESKKKKSSSSVIKTGNIIKSKILSYGFSLFSIGFLIFILTNVVNHYLTIYTLSFDHD
jgi:heme O synthase-like polyprenyltransferase